MFIHKPLVYPEICLYFHLKLVPKFISCTVLLAEATSHVKAVLHIEPASQHSTDSLNDAMIHHVVWM